jgi:hypothetical protein
MVEVFIHTSDRLGVQMVATPMDEQEGLAVSYSITDFNEPNYRT